MSIFPNRPPMTGLSATLGETSSRFLVGLVTTASHPTLPNLMGPRPNSSSTRQAHSSQGNSVLETIHSNLLPSKTPLHLHLPSRFTLINSASQRRLHQRSMSTPQSSLLARATLISLRLVPRHSIQMRHLLRHYSPSMGLCLSHRHCSLAVTMVPCQCQFSAISISICRQKLSGPQKHLKLFRSDGHRVKHQATTCDALL